MCTGSGSRRRWRRRSTRRLRKAALKSCPALLPQAVSRPIAIHCTLRLRRSSATVEKTYDAVVVTTGPGHGGILASQPFLAELAQSGYLELDPTGLGLSCTRNSEAIGPVAGVTPSLLIAGPLARGTFGELMGLPQVTDHAVFVAEAIAKCLQTHTLQTAQNPL